MTVQIGTNVYTDNANRRNCDNCATSQKNPFDSADPMDFAHEVARLSSMSLFPCRKLVPSGQV